MFQLMSGQVQAYDQNGFLVLNEVLNSEECGRAIAVFESHADENFSAIMNLDRKEPLIQEIVRLPIIVDAIEQIQRWDVDAVMSQILFKRAGSPYTTQAWNPHQDNSYPQIPYPLNVTTNLFLTDADVENGCMYLFPGSHRERLLEYVPTPSHKEKPGTNPGNMISIPSHYDKVNLLVKAGSVLIMNSHLIHGSYPNVSPTRSRPLFSVTYVTKGVDVPYGRNAKRIRSDVRPFPGIHFPRHTA